MAGAALAHIRVEDSGRALPRRWAQGLRPQTGARIITRRHRLPEALAPTRLLSIRASSPKGGIASLEGDLAGLVMASPSHPGLPGSQNLLRRFFRGARRRRVRRGGGDERLNRAWCARFVAPQRMGMAARLIRWPSMGGRRAGYPSDQIGRRDRSRLLDRGRRRQGGRRAAHLRRNFASRARRFRGMHNATSNSSSTIRKRWGGDPGWLYGALSHGYRVCGWPLDMDERPGALAVASSHMNSRHSRASPHIPPGTHFAGGNGGARTLAGRAIVFQGKFQAPSGGGWEVFGACGNPTPDETCRLRLDDGRRPPSRARGGGRPRVGQAHGVLGKRRSLPWA